VLQDDGVMEEMVTEESKAVKDRGGGAKALYAGCLKSLGLWCQHSVEDRTHLYWMFPMGQGRQLYRSPWVKEISEQRATIAE
jgi:hypothetical protein